MSTDIRLEIRFEALITEREGMLAENTHRIDCGHSIAYGDEAFFDLAKRICALSDQKPLTKDQIADLNEKHGYFQFADAQGDVTLAFVRDIEKIHGIKETL